ncbi:MAG TPA: phosphate ABC transporter substrate-binding protein PstS [Mycobacterium sp.]|nr:phosphate ABC transporter substrate-binding protein PstS [Mycobacterium sp.]
MNASQLKTAVVASVLLVALSGCAGDRSAVSSLPCAGKQILEASGSTAQAIAMARFITTYERACPGRSVTYTPNDSGNGVSEFVAGKTDFAGTDSPVVPSSADWAGDDWGGDDWGGDDWGGDDWGRAQARCNGNGPWNLPLVFGPIALTYNVFGVDSLVLDPPAIAKIFTGRINTWDAPEIAALNPDLHLPRQPIVVFFRSDHSGTTDNFQKYLQSAAGPAWDRGAGKEFRGGVGRGRSGNAGTSAEIAQTPGSVTYSEWSFAQKQGLSVARIITSAGSEPVTLSAESVTASISGIRVNGRAHDLVLDTSTLYQPTRRGAYPIVLATYEVVCPTYADREVAKAVRDFLGIALTDGQAGLTDIGYVPVTAEIVERLKAAIGAIL